MIIKKKKNVMYSLKNHEVLRHALSNNIKQFIHVRSWLMLTYLIILNSMYVLDGCIAKFHFVVISCVYSLRPMT